jgi:hypothetical protein
VLTCCGSPSLLLRGADAAGEILLDVFGVHVGAGDAILRKAAPLPNPLTKPGFVSIVRETAGAMLKVAQPIEQTALLSVLQKLEARDWYRLSAEQQAHAIEQAMGAIMGVPEIVGPKVRGVLEAVGKDVVLGAKVHGSKAWELDISTTFEAVDKKVIDHIASSQAFYLRNEYGKRSDAWSAVARQIVADGVEQGLDKYDIARSLKAALDGTSAQRTQGYYAMIASVFTARARSYGTLSSFDEAGIEEYEISESLDEVSCNACRFIDGHTFTVSVALGAFNTIAESPDPEAVMDVQPFIGTRRQEDGTTALYYKAGGGRKTVAHVEESAFGQKDEKGKFSHAMRRDALEGAGLTTPPFHPSCRGVVLPVGLSSQVPEDIAPANLAPTIPAPPPSMEQVPPLEPEVFAPANLPANLPELVRPVPVPGRLANPELTPRGTQEEIDATDAKLAHQKLVAEALAKLAALPRNVDPTGKTSFVEHGLAHQAPGPDGGYDFPFTKGTKGELSPTKLAGAAKQKPKIVPISSVTMLSPDAPAGHVKAAIEAKETPVAILVKKGGALYPASLKDQSIIVGAHLKDEGAIAVRVVDLDKGAKPKKAPTAPASAPASAPPSAPVPVRPPKKPVVEIAPPKPMGDAANILHQLDGGAKGSNDGGFYTGADGVKRYVKFYTDAAQPHCEHLANTLYSDLGQPAPSSTLFEHKGKIAYASDLFHGGKTLAELGGVHKLSPEDAKSILKGFVGDVLTGNWDAVGTGFDNVMKLPDGRWVRIDNGGTFLMRAKAGRKSAAVLNAITEWEGFFSSGTNPYYSEVAARAGVSSPDDMKAVVVDEIRKMLALRDAAGGWGPYVANRIEGCPVHDRVRIVDMLEARSKLLEEKLAELTAPPKPPPAPGEARYVAKQYSTTLPKKGLRIEHLPETQVIDDHYEKVDRHNPNKMPSGEKYTEYVKRSDQAIARISSAGREGIQSFTGSGYSSIRDSEDRGKPDHRSNAIQKAFAVSTPEPGTVFRGIHCLPVDIIQKHLENEVVQLGKVRGATSSTSWMIDVSIDSFMGGRDDHNSPAQYKILYVLNGKTQIPIETISSVGTGEHELLFGRDAKFKITGLSRAKGTKRVLIVEAEEIVDEARAAGHTAAATTHPALPTPSAPAKSTTLAEMVDHHWDDFKEITHSDELKYELKKPKFAEMKQKWSKDEIMAAIEAKNAAKPAAPTTLEQFQSTPDGPAKDALKAAINQKWTPEEISTAITGGSP